MPRLTRDPAATHPTRGVDTPAAERDHASIETRPQCSTWTLPFHPARPHGHDTVRLPLAKPCGPIWCRSWPRCMPAWSTCGSCSSWAWAAFNAEAPFAWLAGASVHQQRGERDHEHRRYHAPHDPAAAQPERLRNDLVRAVAASATVGIGARREPVRPARLLACGQPQAGIDLMASRLLHHRPGLAVARIGENRARYAVQQGIGNGVGECGVDRRRLHGRIVPGPQTAAKAADPPGCRMRPS